MTKRIGTDDLATIALPSQPALSPDGNRLMYVLRTIDTGADTEVHRLWIVEGDAVPRQLTHGTADTCPVWSPDGATLAFLRADGGPAQLWLLPAAGGEARKLTDLPYGAGAPVWSPDGTKLAFTAGVDPTRRQPTSPLATEGLDYQLDGAGLVGSLRMQAHVLDVATGAVTQLTWAASHVGAVAFSPDGESLAFTARPASATDLDLVLAVHTVAVDPKAKPRLVAFESGVVTALQYTPEGSSLLLVGHSRGFRGHAGLWRVPLDGGEPVNLAGSLDRNVMPGAPAYPGARPAITPDGHVLFAVRDRGCSHLYSVPLAGGDPKLVVGGSGTVVSGLSLAGGTAAVALASPTSFGEIVTVELASGEQTVRTSNALDDVELYLREAREFEISDGTTVEAWLVRDPEASGPTPLLVDVHGGPHNAWNGVADETHLYHQDLVAAGWSVLLVNPRGSDGYGEDFFTAATGAWGEADAKDFLEPIEALVAEGIADPKRLVVAGYSYGGFMACYLTGRDDRFAAAVTGGVVADLASIGGTSDDAHYLSALELELFPWESGDAERLAELSPITRVDDVRTPTLVLQGTDDLTCPVGQAQQWHSALRERDVPTELVLYPGASHIFPLAGRPSFRLDWGRRITQWVQRWAGDAAGPRPAPLDEAHWQRRLDHLAKLHGVPGAQLGILRIAEGHPDEVIRAAAGTLNANTGQPATVDAIFQIGSVSKVWTATVVMQLVDEGKLTLDQPVKEILPDLRLANDELTDGVTIRHLLTHTSGIDGDVFTDTGRGDDNLAKYVVSLAEAAQNHPLGATWSYCNSGYSILGHVIEKVTGQVWDAAMKERLFTPLGLSSTVTLAEEMLLFATAVGHVQGGENPVVAPVAMLQRSAGPAGLIVSDVEDVLKFARMHLLGGVAADGTRVLSAESTELMTTFQADVPDKYLLGDSWGLGWIRYDWHGHRLIGHDGNTIGQAAFLRLLPEAGLAVTLLTNDGSAHDLYVELFEEIFSELAGVHMQDSLQIPDEPVETDITPHLGTYERAGVRMEVLAGEDGPVLKTMLLGPLAELEGDQTQEYPMRPISQDLYGVSPEGMSIHAPVTFYSLPTGERYLHFGGRATPKVAG